MDPEKLYNWVEKFLLENDIYSEVSTYLLEAYHQILYEFINEYRHTHSVYYLFMDIQILNKNPKQYNFWRDIKNKFYNECCMHR